MAPPKGKKLWRKTIDTREIEDALEKETAAKRKAVKVKDVPDNQLFYVDTAQDAVTAEKLAKGGHIRTGRVKSGPKLLKCQIILNAAHSAKAVNPGNTKPKKLKGLARKPVQQSKAIAPREVTNAVDSTDSLNVWDEEASMAAPPISKKKGRSLIQAVEIDKPGCSFNPDLEQHQDSVAEAVAAEMAKIYAKDHIPQGPRVFNHMPEMGDLEALLDTGGADEDDEEDNEAIDTLNAQPVKSAAISLGGLAAQLQERKTQAARNRQKRGREAKIALQEKKELKKQRRELDRAKDIVKELSTAAEIQEAQAARRAIIKAEKALTEPPKLSKHKYQAPSIQVLLSEEIDGSLRRLKGTPMLAKHRFKNLQKRGVIEPRVRIEKHDTRKRVTFQTGDREEKAKAGNDEATALVKKNATVQRPAGKKGVKPGHKKRR